MGNAVNGWGFRMIKYTPSAKPKNKGMLVHYPVLGIMFVASVFPIVLMTTRLTSKVINTQTQSTNTQYTTTNR